MQKRAVAAVLWFAAVWATYEVVWSLTGLPRMLGPVLAAAIAAVVTVDPSGWFWSRSASRSARTTTPIMPVMSGREQPSS
jgi:hypothetical protein